MDGEPGSAECRLQQVPLLDFENRPIWHQKKFARLNPNTAVTSNRKKKELPSLVAYTSIPYW